jgi:hypothetical protein
MSDDKTKKIPQDSGKISLSEHWEVLYWTKTLGVSEKELREAVKRVGNSAERVKEDLGGKSE